MTVSRFFVSISCLVTLCISSCSAEPNYLVALPRELQCCKAEKVLVSVFTANSHLVPITLQVSDENGNVVAQTDELQVTKGNPAEFSLTVPCNNLPKPKDLTAQRFVTVKAISNSQGLLSWRNIAVRFSPSLVLIQTDKPLYTENDEVNIRVAVLGCNFVPCCDGNTKCVCDVILDIKNPDNVIIDRMTINPCDGAIKRKKFNLGLAPIEGAWNIIAKRTCDHRVISETNFGVKKYVLPRFDVKLSLPKYITPKDENIEIGVSAKFTYGKGVLGSLDVKLGICSETSSKVFVFKQAQFDLWPSDHGSKILTFPLGGYDVYPVGQKLCVIAEATERDSGIKYGTIENSAWITDNPIKIDCDLTPPYYRSNLPLQMQIRARYPNGEVVENVEVNVTQPDGRFKMQTTSSAGLAHVEVDVGNKHDDLEIQVNVKDQALGIKCHFKEFCSPCNGQLTVRPRVLGKQKVGTTADFEIVKVNNNGQLSVTALVVARGSIHSSQTFQSQPHSPVTMFQVPITPQLANRFCVLVYYWEISCNQVVADAVCLETDKACANEISLSLDRPQVQPGENLTIDINVDCPNSEVALLAVDKGLFSLNNDNTLSRDKMFQALDNCSLSCGHTMASSEGVFDVVGLTGISPTSTNMNPTCTCCTKSCQTACLRTDGLCSATGRRKRSNSLNNNCNQLRQQAEALKQQGKTERDVFRFCMDKYTKTIYGEYGRELTEEDSLELYRCCLGPDLRARANLPSEFTGTIGANYQSLIQRRTYFPDVWLQDEFITNGELSTIQRHVKVPDSITDWSIYGMAQCCATGFCVSEPVSLKVSKPVFVECHLPYSLKRLQQVTLVCSAYNYNDHEQTATLTVVHPPKSLCTSAGTGKSTAPIYFKIPARDTQKVLIPVLPLEVGTTQLTVRLVTDLGGDEIVKDIVIEPEGVMRDYDYRVELDPEGVNMNVRGGCTLEPSPGLTLGTCYTSVSRTGSCNSPIEGQFTKNDCCRGQIGSYSLAWSDSNKCELCEGVTEFHSCELNTCPCGGKPTKRQVNYFYIRAPEDYIEGSATAWLGFSAKYFLVEEKIKGKIDDIHGIEGMLRLSGSNGESSSSRFGQNCAIVSFLAATNPGSEAAHFDLLRQGYQYQLKFRKNNGGYSVWAQHTASTWLSSFVLRTMCCAQEFIRVDPVVVSGLINFLGTRQSANGQVVEPQNVYHIEFVGGVQESDVSMTAYTVMSLLECYSVDVTPVLITKVCPAVRYMQIQVRAGLVNRPYAQAIVCLALIKACNYSVCGICRTQGVCDMAVITKLRQDLFRKRVIGSDGSVHWEADTTVGQAYWYRYRPDAISVEMTAYVLQAYLAISDCQTAASIAEWLNSTRNSREAFVSLQDTVVALNALSKFAAGCNITTSYPPNLYVNVTRVSSPNEVFASFNVTSKNAALMQRIRVPVNDVYKVETCGTGLGQAMVHVEYNVPETKTEQCAFNITVSANEVYSQRFGKYHSAAVIEFCVRYLGNNCTGFAVVEVNLPTGYQPCKEYSNNTRNPLCLKEILKTNVTNQLFKYEVIGKSVVFFFDRICNDSKFCIKFIAYRIFEDMRSLPVSVTAYQYYEPGEKCTEFYTLGGGSPELGLTCDRNSTGSHTCVCGARRCPKLEKIHNRLCNACIHHQFAYKVAVCSTSYINGWWEYRVNVAEILKPGPAGLRPGAYISLWLPSLCKLQFDLQVGKTYHFQGLGGSKFVISHNTHVEPWPDSTAKECKKKVIQKCIKGPCHKHNKRSKIKECEERRRIKCLKALDHCNSFENYVTQLKDSDHCKLDNVCAA